MYINSYNISTCFLLSSADFLKYTFSNDSLRYTISVSNGLDQNQDRHFVGPDLGPNCLQRQMTKRNRKR